MAMEYIPTSYVWDQILYNKNGTVFADYAPETFVFSDAVASTKESVDVGEFIPGRYRVNPYSVSSEKLSFPSVSLQTVNLTYPPYFGRYLVTDVSGQIGSGAVPLAKDFPPYAAAAEHLRDRAILRAQSAVAANVIGAGENLGELTETIKMLRDPFKGLRDYLSNSNHRKLGLYQKLEHYLSSGVWDRKGRGSEGADAAKAAADAWLEFRYGLMPLVYTVQDIIEMANAQANVFDANQIHTARSHLSDTIRNSKSGSFNVSSIRCSARTTYDVTIDVHACLQYRMSCPQGLPDKLGLTPWFIPEVAYELTRLSFVMDWWFEVGDWLGAMRIKPGISILGNTMGTRITASSVVKLMSYKYSVTTPIPESYESGATVVEYDCQSYDRVVNYATPLLPQYTEMNPLNLLRAIDSVSLILQPILKRLKKSR